MVRRLGTHVVRSVRLADLWLVRAGRSCCVARSQAELRRTLAGDEPDGATPRR